MPSTAKNATITATFNSRRTNGSGADGITFFPRDASKTFGVGAYGGSIGYAQKTTAGGGGADINGMNGGYIGVGIDEFGNFSNATEGRIGGIGFTPNSISVRGPGQGLTGYDYLGGTNGLGTQIAFPGSTSRPTGANTRSLEVVITSHQPDDGLHGHGRQRELPTAFIPSTFRATRGRTTSSWVFTAGTGAPPTSMKSRTSR